MLPPRTPNCIWNKPNFIANASLCSDSFQYTKIFCESLINSDFFFTSRVGPDILINELEDWALFGQPELCFHSGVLLKMPPSSPGQIKITSQIPNLLNMFKTKHNYIYQLQKGIYKFLLSIFLFICIISNKELKLSLIKIHCW